MRADVDLSELDPVDLAALRLAAQVMGHKAELAARPHVETFFRGLQGTVDGEISRRRQVPGGRTPTWVGELPSTEDLRLTAEYLDLLRANTLLPAPVRDAVRQLREQLGAVP